MIRLVILDIDGVMTDGTKIYGVDGLPFAKSYCDKDFTAIKRLKGANVKVCFLSGDETVNREMAQNRNVQFHLARGKDKADFVSLFEKLYDVSSSDMAYVGDDLFDSSIMREVGHPYCPSDACKEIRHICKAHNILSCRGGDNAIANFLEVLLDRQLVPECTMEDIERLDKLEVF